MGGKSAEQGMLEVVSLLSDIQREIRRLDPYLAVRDSLVADGKVLVVDVQAAIKNQAAVDETKKSAENGKLEAVPNESKSKVEAKGLVNSAQDSKKSEKVESAVKETTESSSIKSLANSVQDPKKSEKVESVVKEAKDSNSTKLLANSVQDSKKSKKPEHLADEASSAKPLATILVNSGQQDLKNKEKSEPFAKEAKEVNSAKPSANLVQDPKKSETPEHVAKEAEDANSANLVHNSKKSEKPEHVTEETGSDMWPLEDSAQQDVKEDEKSESSVSKEVKEINNPKSLASILVNSAQEPKKNEKPKPVANEVKDPKPLDPKKSKNQEPFIKEEMETNSAKPLSSILVTSVQGSKKSKNSELVKEETQTSSAKSSSAASLTSKTEGNDKLQPFAKDVSTSSELLVKESKKSEKIGNPEPVAKASRPSMNSSGSTMATWRVLKKKLPPELFLRLKSWLTSVSQARKKYETNIATLTRILEMTKDLKSALHEYPVLAHPGLICKVMDYKDIYSKWRTKLISQRRVYDDCLEQFPGNPYLNEGKAPDKRLNHMEESRPFPNAWKRANNPAPRFFFR